ncbi:MAG: class I SAM-dependent methyltransferase [bacterium]
MNKRIDKDHKFDWDSFYKVRSNQNPRETVLKVLEIFEKENIERKKLLVIDLGCGHGADTLELLKRNWRVLAIDNDLNGLKLLEQSVLPEWKNNLQTSKQPFESVKLKKCDLINAGYSIPFCSPEYFMKLWNEIVHSIKPGGRFSGQLFGVNDDWSNISTMTFHTKEQVLKLFDKFEIEYFEEKDADGFTAEKVAKHWHVFSVVAKKVKN